MTTSTKGQATFHIEDGAAAFAALWQQWNEPRWLLEWRQFCLEQAQALYWPESRYTRLRGFRPQNFLIAMPGRLRRETIRDTKEARIWVEVENGSVTAIRVPHQLASVVQVDGFREMVGRDDARLREFYQGRALLTPLEHSRPSALLHGLWTDGLWIDFGRGADDLKPQVIIKFHEPRAQIGYTFPVVVHVQGYQYGSVLIEAPPEPDAPQSLAVHGLEMHLHQNAELHVQGIWCASEAAYDFHFAFADLDRDARLNINQGWFGNRLTMARQMARLNGPGAWVKDVQVLFGHRRQHFDFQSLVQHIGTDTTSDVMMRGVLKDRARNVFYGMIRIEHGARNANALLQDHVMLLNTGAHADAIPALEIEENEVRCSHSASVGEIDEEKVFYAMSRGLDESEARKLIVSGFLAPALENIPVDEIRLRIIELLDAKWSSSEASS